MKYKIKVDSFATKFISRTVTVYAKSDEEAIKKAIDISGRKQEC